MKNTLFGYNQAVAIELGLSLEDLCILRWFEDFVNTGKMQVFEIDGASFYWVKYDYVVKQLPIIADDKRKIKSKFKRIIDLNLLDFHLLKRKGNYSLYKLNEENHKKLIENDEKGVQQNVQPYTENGTPLVQKMVQPCTENGTTKINLSNIHLSDNSSIKNTSTRTSIGDIDNFINLSFENEQVREKVFLFLENCASLKKQKNYNAVKVFVDKLKKYDDERKIELIDDAIEKGWLSIYPRDDYSKAKGDKSTQPLADTSYDISRADKLWDKVPSLI